MAERRNARCVECDRIREMATTELCFTCYRRHKRAMERAEDNPYTDLHTSPISKEGRRVLAGYNKLLGALSDLRLSRDGVHEVIDIVKPWLKPAKLWLNLSERERPASVHVHESVSDAKQIPAQRERESVHDDECIDVEPVN